MMIPSTRKSGQLALASVSVVVVVYRVLIWRARSRARKSLEKVEELVESGGPLVRKQCGELSRHEIQNQGIIAHGCFLLSFTGED